MSTSEATVLTRAEQLGGRLAAQRLNRNLTQRQLADNAAVALNTLRRLEDGDNVSLDTLIRVLEALGLGDRLEALAPPADVRPVDRVRIAAGSERKRASGAGQEPPTPWSWSDDQ
ncbi:MAG: helix-turn-helix domain-containing protein [Brevundimonas sp.]|uniref:helix-turn-helix domain-containing protein n=1 Tax=Brevundimonas sp. TaxID=1871086 RepID=UPI002488BF3D|nr:helix-turn-helix domain-containing protein [Brevundimonas sp.]MDI1328333.1 helix-turn-helix domain-containing protein [Brevundimonas sp.]